MDAATRLDRLPSKHRIAFIAGCAQRVVPIYSMDYGDPEPLAAALDVAWRFACGGDDIASIEPAVERVAQATPKIEQEGDQFTAAMFACISVVSVLHAIIDSTVTSAVAAMNNALDAVDVFCEGWTGQTTPSEEQWQERALQLVENWGNKPIMPQMFDSLGDIPPSWTKLGDS